MTTPTAPKSSDDPKGSPAVENVAHAHNLLKALRERIGEHPELAEAITKLEVALSTLTVKTGGML